MSPRLCCVVLGLALSPWQDSANIRRRRSNPWRSNFVRIISAAFCGRRNYWKLGRRCATGAWTKAECATIEDRSILTALAMQRAAGVQIFTDGEYRRDIFTADITKALDGLVPGKPVVKFEWRGKGKQLAEESKEGNLQYIVGGKLRRKGRFTPNEAPFLKQHAPGPFKVCTPAAMQHAIMRYRPGCDGQVLPDGARHAARRGGDHARRSAGADRRRRGVRAIGCAVVFELLRPEPAPSAETKRH